MEFLGPSRDDFDNVRALNRSFLELARSGAAGEALPGCSLSTRQAERLAASPFLLFSLREHDEILWKSLESGPSQDDLVSRCAPSSSRRGELQAAALAFVWQLARRDPYSVRVLSGASPGWCERLVATTLMRLLAWAATRDVLGPRFARDSAPWRHLRSTGADRANTPRRHAHMRALQLILTHTSAETRPLRAAACASPEASRRSPAGRR